MTTEAQLGLIGGTMGLLTGFSILSGVEIIYYLLRFLFQTLIMKTLFGRPHLITSHSSGFSCHSRPPELRSCLLSRGDLKIIWQGGIRAGIRIFLSMFTCTALLACYEILLGEFSLTTIWSAFAHFFWSMSHMYVNSHRTKLHFTEKTPFYVVFNNLIDQNA